MTSLQGIVGTLQGYIIYFAAFFITAAQLAVLIRLTQKKQGIAHIAGALLHFLIDLTLLALLLDYSYNALIEEAPEVLYDFELRVLSLPWLIFAGLEIVSAAVIILYVRFFRRYHQTHLTPDAIRQTMDHLSTGIMVSEPDGTVLLSNLKMTSLCREMTGELLSDARRFWKYIENDSADYLIHAADGKTWQFARSTITLDGKCYDQVTAVDMTEQYLITEELSGKNRRLKAVQDQMKAVAARELALTAAREVMNARMTVHNRMGAVLLSGKYYLDHPDNVKEEELLRLLEFSNNYILGEAEHQEKEKEPLTQAVEKAGRIGVAVEVHGELPENETVLRIIAQAVEQCAANTARHARGDKLNVRVRGEGDMITAEFSNNGIPPKNKVTETGGLAILRKTVESAEGSMCIQSEPVFRLVISLPDHK